MNIGSRLKQVLEERGISANRLAHEAGVPAQTLYAMIKRDSNKADMDIMARLLRALDMELTEFMGQDWQKTAQLPKQEPGPGERKRRGEYTGTGEAKLQETGTDLAEQGAKLQGSEQGAKLQGSEQGAKLQTPSLNTGRKAVRRRNDLEDYLL